MNTEVRRDTIETCLQLTIGTNLTEAPSRSRSDLEKLCSCIQPVHVGWVAEVVTAVNREI